MSSEFHIVRVSSFTQLLPFYSPFCMFFWLSPHPVGTSSVHVVCSFVTLPYGNDTIPGRTDQPSHPIGMAHSLEIPVLTSNPVGIDPLQDATVKCYSSYTMLTEMKAQPQVFRT